VCIFSEIQSGMVGSLEMKFLSKLSIQSRDLKCLGSIYLDIKVGIDQEFQHFHLPGSRHVELQKLTNHLSKLQKESKGKKIVFVCKTGIRSGVATQLARTRNIDALNLIGGVTEWSRLNFPRIRPQVCIDNHLA